MTMTQYVDGLQKAYYELYEYHSNPPVGVLKIQKNEIAHRGEKNITNRRSLKNLLLVPSIFGWLNLVLQLKDVMKKQDELPVCKEGDVIMNQLVELTSKACGCLLVIDSQHHLVGTFTDGDLRRTLKAYGEGIFKLTVGQVCNRNPRTIGPEAMAVEAMQKMESPPSPV